MGLPYEKAKKKVMFGLYLLGVVTLVEVFFSLLGKGHIIGGFKGIGIIGAVIGLILIVLSLYKAWFIIFEFMHMKYEVKSLTRTVLLPTTLLIWAIIAFFWEGSYWKNSRNWVKTVNEQEVDNSIQPLESEVAPMPADEPEEH